MTKYMNERDTFFEEVKEINDGKIRIEREKNIMQLQNKELTMRLNKEIRELTDDANKKIDEIMSLNKEV